MKNEKHKASVSQAASFTHPLFSCTKRYFIWECEYVCDLHEDSILKSASNPWAISDVSLLHRASWGPLGAGVKFWFINKLSQCCCAFRRTG